MDYSYYEKVWGYHPMIAGYESLQLKKDIAKKGMASLGTKAYRKYGTIMNVANTNAAKCFPTR